MLERLFSRWVHSLIECEGVSPARLRLLGVLHCRGSQKMCDLSQELGVTARNITTLVDALEEEKLVRRTPHATDRRATVVELTSRGNEQASVVAAEFKQRVADLFRDLPEEDQRELLRLIDALLDALHKRVQIECDG
jgi:DNA-binding MarR family transcriptional regulator